MRTMRSKASTGKATGSEGATKMAAAGAARSAPVPPGSASRRARNPTSPPGTRLERAHEPEIAAESELRLRLSGLPALGARQIGLLRGLESRGSLHEAAQVTGITYRTAWTWIESLNRLSREPLVAAVRGGRGGGGTRLTAHGSRILSLYAALEEEGRRRERAWSGNLDGLDEILRLARRASLRTSARNQLHGKVARIVRDKVAAEVVVALSGGDEIVSQVTLGSVADLDLRRGRDVWALIKAHWIVVAVGATEPLVSARNRLRGTIASVKPGAVSTEVEIGLSSGTTLAAIVTRESEEALDLRRGETAWVLFKASSVILGIDG